MKISIEAMCICFSNYLCRWHHAICIANNGEVVALAKRQKIKKVWFGRHGLELCFLLFGFGFLWNSNTNENRSRMELDKKYEWYYIICLFG